MPTIDERIERLLDQLENSSLTTSQVEMIERKIRFLQQLKQEQE